MLKSGDDPLEAVVAEILVSTLRSRSQVEPTKFSTTSSGVLGLPKEPAADRVSLLRT